MTNVKGLKPIESKAVDLHQFEGKRIRLESAEVVTVPSKFSNNGNGKSEVLKVQSEPFGTIQDRDGNDVPIRASELFNLTRGENGELGWPTGPNGKLANFMKKLAAKHPSELPGKEVAVHPNQSQLGRNRSGVPRVHDGLSYTSSRNRDLRCRAPSGARFLSSSSRLHAEAPRPQPLGNHGGISQHQPRGCLAGVSGEGGALTHLKAKSDNLFFSHG